MPAQKTQSNGLNILIAAAIISLILYNIPFGGYITYPFFILCTWFHEMGHGVAALLMGGSKYSFKISFI